MDSTTQDQIYFLRLLSKYDSDLKVSLDGKTKWIPLFDIIRNPPNFPISHRTILKSELVLEIDNDDWSIARDGTRKILSLLEKWGANRSYYLSFSGNHSVHIHVFFSLKSVDLDEETAMILEDADKDEIRREIKRYVMRQIPYATDTPIDTNLASVHLIRFEGSINEKSGKYCSMIESIPDDKPERYDVKIPDSLPPRLWDLSFMKDELNVFLRIHFRKKAKPIYFVKGKPVDNPERVIDILRPVYLPGYRHNIILALSGYLKRHAIPLDVAIRTVKSLGKKDKELSSRLYSVKEVYRADVRKRISGLPKLLEIVRKEGKEGKITPEVANSTISNLSDFHSKSSKKEELK